MKKNRKNSDLTEPIPAQKEKKKDKKSKKAKKSAVESKQSDTLVFSPSKNTVGNGTRVAGYICRAIVIWFSVMGLAFFINDAFSLGVSTANVAAASFFPSLFFALICWGGLCSLISICVGAATLAVFLLTQGNALDLIADSALSLFNAILERLYDAGYLAYIRFAVGVSTDEPREKLLAVGLGAVCLLISACFVPCLIKKAKIIPPAVLSVLILVPIFMFNISQGNRGISLVIISFAAVIVMYFFDRLYAKGKVGGKAKQSDVLLFCESERPRLSAEAQAYLDGCEADKKNNRRAQKKAKKKKMRENTYTVDEELSDYFSKTSRKPKKVKHDKDKLKAIKKELRLQKAFDRTAIRTDSSSGGFAGIFMLLLCTLVILIPSASVSGAFNTLPALDDSIAIARKYVTATLKGDDPVLDQLEYEADSENFEPHSTDAEPLSFNKTQLFFVEVNQASNIYMRNWVGVDYREGGWYPASDEQLSAYRELYGISEFPHETLSNAFLSYMLPTEAVDLGHDYVESFRNMDEYGYVTTLVNVRRVNNVGSYVNMPSYFYPPLGVMNYGTFDVNEELTFINYFDGIYTGRKFKEDGVKYAFLSNVPTMKDPDRAENIANLIAEFNLSDEAILLKNSCAVDIYGNVDSHVTLEVTEVGDYMRFTYKYKHSGKKADRVYLHPKSDVKITASNVAVDYVKYTVTAANGTVLTIETDRYDQVMDVSCKNAYGDVLFDDYLYGMTSNAQSEYLDFSASLGEYGDFVYDTYTKESGSAVIEDLADSMKSALFYDGEQTDPEGEKEKLPVDVAAAIKRNSSDAETYLQRDRLVRSVIDYIIDDLGCEYTITPDVSLADASLDGVENFLTVTKQGYCVQFASAAALILREYGLPVRYVEGYIACDFSRSMGDDATARYKAYVHDYEAHAWIEVWFDGVGWVQYETTPEYYDAMYGTGESSSSSGSSGIILDQIDKNDPEGDEEETSEEEEETTLTPEEQQEQNDLIAKQEAKERAIKNTAVFLSVAAVIVAIAIILSRIRSRASYESGKRRESFERIMSEDFGYSTDEADRREMAISLSDSVYSMLEIYGISPKTGEFSGEFALRASIELADIFGYPEGYKPEKPGEYKRSKTDFVAILDALSAEEFGHGMTPEQMKQVAVFDMTLRKNAKTRVKLFKRLYLHYIKRLI